MNKEFSSMTIFIIAFAIVLIPALLMWWLVGHFSQIVGFLLTIAWCGIGLYWSIIVVTFVGDHIGTILAGAAGIIVLLALLRQLTHASAVARPASVADMCHVEIETIRDTGPVEAARLYANRHRLIAMNPEWIKAFEDYENTGELAPAWPHTLECADIIDAWYQQHPWFANLRPLREALYYDSNLSRWRYANGD
jgi:hypothetical protein